MRKFTYIMGLAFVLLLCGCGNKYNVEKSMNNVTNDSDVNEINIKYEEGEEIEVNEYKKEITFNFNSEDYDTSYDKSDYIYTYALKDNNGSTIVESNVKNLADEDLKVGQIFNYNFIKDDVVVKTRESSLVEDVTCGNYGAINVFLDDIPISDFDSIEINIKE